ncbi:hypothetical protein ACFFRL_11995 [Agromyces hippuratus]
MSMDGLGGDPVWFSDGVRLVKSEENGDTVSIAREVTSAATYVRQLAGGGYSQGAAWYDAYHQDARISNRSGSVSAKAIGGNCGSFATVEVTLTRPSAEPTKPVYRFWSEKLRAHFYTISETERDHVIATWPRVWSYEGPKYEAFDSQVAGTVPLYRFWSNRYQAHFYTTDEAEKARVIAKWPDVWKYEKVAYYVYPLDSTEPNTVAMARFWSPRNSRHFYTADPVERDMVIKRWPSPIWDYESDVFRVPADGLVE